MAEVGTASMTIVPKFDNLEQSVKKALGDASKNAGVQLGDGISQGIGSSNLAKTGVLVGIFSQVTNMALSQISSHVESAASRLDTLNNYPRVMQSLGYSAEEASNSLSAMDSHLQGLPTALNDMVSTVQGLTAVTGDINRATQLGLAMNDMLLASGSSQQMVNAAQEQFRQILSKGKPEMQDWKSLMQAAPGQLTQIAKAMLGTQASAQDLYEYLGGGAKDAFYPDRMQEFTDAIIRLDKEGGDGITSFAEQAKTATGGINTSMENLGTALTRGIAKVMDAFGGDTIREGTASLKIAIDASFTAIADGVRAVMPSVKKFATVVSELAPTLAVAFGAGAIGNVATKVLPTLASKVKEVAFAFQAFKGGAATFGEALQSIGLKANPVAIGVTAAAAALGVLGVALYSGYTKSKDFEKATVGLSEAVKQSTAYVTASNNAFDALDPEPIIASYQSIRKAIDDSVQAHIKLIDSINSRTEEASANIGLLQAYRREIGQNINKSIEGVEAQERFKMAVDELNKACGTQYEVIDAANGVIVDQNEVIQTNTDAIFANIDAKIKQIQQEAAAENYKDAYKQQQVDLANLTKAQNVYNDAKANYIDTLQKAADGDVTAAANLKYYEDIMNNAAADMRNMEGVYQASADAAGDYAKMLGNVGDAASAVGIAMENLGDGASTAASLTGMSIDELSKKFADSGVAATTLSTLGSQGLAELAKNCEGDSDRMIRALTGVDDFKIGDKTYRVSDDGTIRDESGKIVSLIGDIKSVPSQKTTEFKADTSNFLSKVRSAFSEAKQLANSAGAPSWTTWATGGFAALHADGAFITNGATFIGRDSSGVAHIAGEAGRELVQRHADGTTSIIPIENRKYLKPFASVVADMIEPKTPDMSGAVIAWLDANLGPIIANYTPTLTSREMGRVVRSYS